MAVTIREHFALPIPSDFQTTSSCFMGIECEIESIAEVKSRGFFTKKEDNSLRNNGWEFVSPPSSKEYILEEFKNLQANLVFYDKEDAFSERTSTHVHLNCAGLDLKQTRNVMLLYALFEEIFFGVVKSERRDNIHCVPLTETHLPSRYARPLQDLVGAWSKYTALNLLPLKSYGTIEFRHLHGTGDAVLLEQWLTYIENLWKLGQTVEINAQTLGNPQTILKWYTEIFNKIIAGTSVLDTISNSLLDLKLAV